MIFDFHVHSNASLDSNIRVKELVRILRARRFDGSALTDHNSIKNLKEAKAEFKRYRLEFVPGTELTTKSGHVIALFVEDFVRPHRPLDETLDAIRSMGGISVIPHPFDIYRKNVGVSAIGMKFDCVEVLNARDVLKSRERFVDEYFRGATHVAGSDAHSLREIGSAYTKILGDDVYKSLKRGMTEVRGAHSPFTVHARSILNRMENFIGTPFDTKRVLSSM